MWKKSDEDSPATSLPASHPSPAPRPAAEPRRGGSSATIGESIRVQGEIHGDEDLLIEGEVDGSVHLDKHSVTVGRSGRVKADIHGGTLVVEGKVQGNLFAGEQVVVRSTGEVRGNITSPRVSLEDGSKFKGSIDMEPRGAGRPAETKPDERREPTSKPNGSPSAASASGAPAGPGSAGGAGGAGGTGGKDTAAPRSGAGTP
jgi:cytoskeletal protein CcmA (bactofilin family)